MLCRRLWHLEISPQNSFLHQFLHSCFCRFFLIRATFHRRLLVTTVESFSLARQKLSAEAVRTFYRVNKQWTLKVFAMCVRSADAQWSEVDLTHKTRIEQIKLCSRIEVFCKHMFNTVRGATSWTIKSSLCEMRKKVRGNSLIAVLVRSFLRRTFEPSTNDLHSS